MAEVPSALPGFRARTSLALGFDGRLAQEDGGVSRERRATRLVARSREQAGPHLSARHGGGNGERPGDVVWRTAPERLCAGRAANLGRDGTEAVARRRP